MTWEIMFRRQTNRQTKKLEYNSTTKRFETDDIYLAVIVVPKKKGFID